MTSTSIAAGPAAVKLAVLPYESPGLTVCRLGTQARMNDCGATPCGLYGRIQWRVTSQRAGARPHIVTLTEGRYTCSCPATGMCAHIALVRTTITDCPACAGPLTVFAPPRGSGALYCVGCGVRADLDPDETEGLWCYEHGMGGNVRLLVAAIVARVHTMSGAA